MNKRNRFDYVQYTEASQEISKNMKELFINLEEEIDKQLSNGRAKSLVLTKLEETYMWIGKAIRDDQLAYPAKIKGEQ